MNDKIRISGIIQEDTANGPGIRTTIFTQGCEIHCPGCQNSQTWDINGGTEYTVEELLEKIHDDILSYAVTISGGEPTLQYRQLLPLVQHLKHEGYNLEFAFSKISPFPKPNSSTFSLKPSHIIQLSLISFFKLLTISVHCSFAEKTSCHLYILFFLS